VHVSAHEEVKEFKQRPVGREIISSPQAAFSLNLIARGGFLSSVPRHTANAFSVEFPASLATRETGLCSDSFTFTCGPTLCKADS
jgi:hypothetical protein